MGVVKEFRTFALKGNVVDMAVGVIIGGAFGGIVKSLIDDIIMPVVGILGKADFSNWYIGLNDQTREAIAKASPEAVPTLAKAREIGQGPILAYGNFITVTINFLILSCAVFILVKALNTARRRLEREQAAAGPADLPADVKLLTEIRDLLKARS